MFLQVSKFLSHKLSKQAHLREWKQGLSLDVAPDLVDRGGQLVDLPHDVVGHALRVLGQVLLVLHDGGNHLEAGVVNMNKDQLSEVPNKSLNTCKKNESVLIIRCVTRTRSSHSFSMAG